MRVEDEEGVREGRVMRVKDVRQDKFFRKNI